MKRIIVPECDFKSANIRDVIDEFHLICYDIRGNATISSPETRNVNIKYERRPKDQPITLQAKNASLYSLLAVVAEICELDTKLIVHAMYVRIMESKTQQSGGE